MQRDQAHRTNELLERIAKALEKSNVTKAVELSGQRNKELSAKGILDAVKVITDDYASKHPVDKLQGSDAVTHADIHNAKYNNEIPGFEGTLDALDNLTPTSDNPDPAGYGIKDNLYHDKNYGFDGLVEYETDLQGIRVDSDHDIRSTAMYYEEALSSVRHMTLNTKKDAILDYVTNEFGTLGARYTDIIKFAYYLGEPNAPKYTNSNRGYYSCAFNTRFGGHLIKGGKDQLVKGINNEGKEKYFALSFVDQATDYYKRIK